MLCLPREQESKSDRQRKSTARAKKKERLLNEQRATSTQVTKAKDPSQKCSKQWCRKVLKSKNVRPKNMV